MINKHDLLSCVAKGDELGAEKILKDNPALLSQPGDVVDFSGREFENVTAFQLAIWYKDAYMCKMILNCIADDNERRGALLEQYNSLDENGLNYTLDGTSFHEKSYDFKPIIDALSFYMDHYDEWVVAGDWMAVEDYWCKTIGVLQRYYPAHVAQEYCNPVRPSDTEKRIAFNATSLKRSFNFYDYRTNKDVKWFPLALTETTGLGLSFGVLWAAGGGGRLAKQILGDKPAGLVDLNAMTALDEIRTADILQLKENLL
jgi:hypothetical protein